ncbi:hypothetical protein SteCoe_36301 [Stentor coeruleus]|uniref:Uncharacterized protein n=1 Tax=Stentor coeruleus TaxID=5963 RepID=A0A1R2AQJ4_9CILI|nr:hypothetical protein SteCoe_36301 [Stentor coeruleus]
MSLVIRKSVSISPILAEFRQTLKNYTKTLEKAKSQQSLKNYQAKYRDYVKGRVSRIREKSCIKVNTMIQPSLFTIHPYDIFSVLLSSKKSSVSIKIPKSLFVTSSGIFFLYYNKKLIIESDSTVFDRFSNSLSHIDGLPLCIFKPDDGKSMIFFSLNDLDNYFQYNQKVCGVYQQFVRISGSRAAILITHAKIGSYSKSYYIQNKEKILGLKDCEYEHKELKFIKTTPSDSTNCTQYNFSSPSSPLFTKLPLKIIDKEEETSTFLNKRQLSYCITKKPSGLLTRIRNFKHLEDIKKQTQKLICVNPQDSKSFIPYIIKTNILEVDRMTKIVFSIVSQEVKQKFNKDVQEVKLVFMKDKYDGWVFLKVDTVKTTKEIDYEEIKEENMHEYKTSSSDFDAYNSSPVNVKLTVKKAVKNLKTVNPFIKIKNFPHYKAKSSMQETTSNKSYFNDIKFQSLIDEGALNYDISRFSSPSYARLKHNIRDKFKTTTIWENISSSFLIELQKSRIFNFFQDEESDKMNTHSLHNLKVFLCDIDYNFKQTLRCSHKNLRITSKDFDLYETIFANVLNEYLKDSEEIEIILANMHLIKDAIVSNR